MKKDNEEEAIVDFILNFDSNNILANTSDDDFPGECLSSTIHSIEVLIEE